MMNEYKIKAKIKKSGRIEPSQIDDDLLELIDEAKNE